MKKITRQSLVKDIAVTWRNQYPHSKEDIWNKLKLFDGGLGPDQVDAVIGNDSWTQVPHCTECGEKVEEVIEIGEQPDHESKTVNICRKCVHKAWVLFEAEL